VNDNRDIISQILDKVNIVDVIGRYINVRKTGKNFMAVCPFHDDKGPSLSISEERGLFHCFGCGKSGNVIQFLMEYEHIPFPDALKKMADEAGVSLGNVKKNEKLDRLREINAMAAGHYFDNLMNDAAARDARLYLKDRKVMKSLIEQFGIGYASAAGARLYSLFEKKGVSMEEADKLFLARRGANGPYDMFRDRIMFPIRDASGRVIAFGGRALREEQKPKYLNSSETPLFSKSRVLYGFDVTKGDIYKEKAAIIVEGYMDMLALYQYGVKNVVAVLGTAFTAEHAALLKNRVERIYLFFDNDAAGKRATMRSLEILFSAGISCYVIENNMGKDPDELLKEHGRKALDDMIGRAAPGFDHYVAEKTKNADMSNPQEKAAAYKAIAASFKGLKDKESAAFYMQALDRRFGVRNSRPPEMVKSKKTRGKAPSFKTNELLFLVFALDRPAYAARLSGLGEDIRYYFTDNTLLDEALNVLESVQKNTGKSRYTETVKDREVLSQLSSLLLRDALGTDDENFEAFFEDVLRKIDIEKKREVIFEKNVE